jgi:hypothetical protein
MKRWLGRNWLMLLVSVGIMLASSGVDGVYMGAWQPDRWHWLGLVVNTMFDIASPVITYKYGVLNRNAKKRKYTWPLLVAEVIAIGFSWFFGWRQLRIVMPIIEPTDWGWVAPVSAAATPLVLAAIGYAMSLGETVITDGENAQVFANDGALSELRAIVEQQAQQIERLSWPVARMPDWDSILNGLNGERAEMTETIACDLLAKANLRAPSPRTLVRFVAKAKGVAN